MPRRSGLVLLWALAFAGAARPAAAALFAAGGKVEITPDLKRHKVLLAGYGATGRKIDSVHDPLFARGFVVSDGTHTVGFIVVEVLGLYREEVEAIRRSALQDPDKESLLVAASHTHSGPDTVGLWGPFIGVSGVDPAYQAYVRERVAGLYKELKGRLEPAEVRASSKVLDPHGLILDLRPPRAIDSELRLLDFRAKGKPGKRGKPIGVLVNYSCHAEALGEMNHSLSADFPGVLCGELEKEHGACAFFPGEIGGMQSPDVRRDTMPLMFEEMERIGKTLAGEAKELLKKDEAVPVRELRWRSEVVRVPIENSRYLLFLPSLRFGHKVYDADGGLLGGIRAQLLRLRHLLHPLGPGQFPLTETEVARIDLGSIQILAVPGELFPELYIGGYDGSYAYGDPMWAKDNPSPPEVSKAPPPPYLRDLMTGRHKFLFGLANDMLGYIMPSYDFKVTPGRSMLPQPPGHHYEETNSVGRNSCEIIVETARRLLREP